MISSESINFSKYSKINENNTNSNDLEIIDTKENTKKNEDQKELSQTLMISNTEEKEKEKNDIKETKNESNDKLYGNPYNEIYPKYLGKCFAFFFNKNGNPRLTIGPDCKFYN